MSFPLYWTPTAKDDFMSLLKLVEQKGNSNKALALIEKTEKVVENIANAPRDFPYFEHDDRFRIAEIDDKTSVIFQVTSRNGRLLYFWDSRKGKA